jgi:uncharacterized protein (DUF427 family)
MSSPAAPAVTSTDEFTRRHPVPPGDFTFEPSERHVRGVIGGIDLVDSYAPTLVWEPAQAVPGYVFPRTDIRADLLTAAAAAPSHGRHPRVRQWYDVEVNGVVYPALVFQYEVTGLEDYLAVDWFRREEPGVEHWYEEDEEIFRHPRDPYKRVDPIRSSRHVKVYVDGLKIADTHRPVLLFETRLPIRYYIPADDVDLTLLEETDLATTCPYKGNARYWSVKAGENVRTNIVWSYPSPIAAAAPIKDHLAFYNEVVDIVVDGVALARPESEFSEALAARNA